MNTELCAEALEIGQLARRALDGVGGIEVARHAAQDPRAGDELVQRTLLPLGAFDLDPLGSEIELEAAAALCRAAGSVGAPSPLAERLLRPQGENAEGIEGAVIVGPDRRARIGGLEGTWWALDLHGATTLVRPRSVSGPIAELEVLEGIADQPERRVAAVLVLGCWTLLGTLDRALEMACGYAQDRQQFGAPLSSFQGLQFQLTEAEVERAGLEVLAHHALWSLQTGRDDALSDGLALRLAGLEAAEVVLRTAHQVHGAIGFCDETELSWLSRSVEPLRRLPFGTSQTTSLLGECLGAQPLTGLFTSQEAAR
jgi:hypothetical protein